MLIRRYVGSDEKVVLQRVRAELGSDAVILHTAYVTRRSGFLGLSKTRHIEIVAGRGFKVVRDFPGARPAPAPAPETLRREMAEVRKLVAETQDRLRTVGAFDGPPELAGEYTALAASKVSEVLARQIVERIRQRLPAEKLRDRALIRIEVRGLMKEMIRCADDGIVLRPGRCTRVALIGPTGVGKTTTIAKLVSIYAHQGREVAVVTNDTYRIAAAEQIKRVAQLVGVPIRVCGRPEEMQKALADFSDRDLVLIDTAGRSQKSPRRLEELKEVLAAAKPDETHLVVSMTTQPETVVDVAERFAPCGYDHLVITKLDEAVKAGVVLDVLARVQTDLSFVTTGQEIPRDIEVADSSRLAALILGEESL